MEKVLGSLPDEQNIPDAIIRLVLEYPRDLDLFIDEPLLREKCSAALEFRLIRRPQEEARLRLPGDRTIASLTPLELLDTYWKSVRTETTGLDHLQTLAASIIQAVSGEEPAEGEERNN